METETQNGTNIYSPTKKILLFMKRIERLLKKNNCTLEQYRLLRKQRKKKIRDIQKKKHQDAVLGRKTKSDNKKSKK
jgi:hypothetical protein